MNYKFLIQPDARLCSNHIGVSNYWPLVKQVSNKVPHEDHKMISDLMFGYYQELSKKSNQAIFNIDHIDSIENDTFKVCL